MKTVFTTWCTDDYIQITGCDKLMASAKFFHPDIPFYRFNKKPHEVSLKYPHALRETMIPISVMDVLDDYDLIVHLDADSTITGPLTEILEADYEVAGVRNNNDMDSEGHGRYFTLQGIPYDEFLNAGLVASTRKEFWLDWNEWNKEKAHLYAGKENDTLNYLFHSKKYKSKILDPKSAKVFYGIASVWGQIIDGKYRTWDSWKRAYIKDDKLFIDSTESKQIKVIHQAGGEDWYPKQVYENFFSAEVQEYLKKITS